MTNDDRLEQLAARAVDIACDRYREMLFTAMTLPDTERRSRNLYDVFDMALDDAKRELRTGHDEPGNSPFGSYG